ncbi:hypothetical protein QYE76_002419 [Lolium multiflorum]|uniref:Retrotransposon gag domain-containing protein n=1 Tax=Lolium multiflorum TaxID=4521 RepID=A0AAD8RNB7_LOLMU|nr:hypothetical protein QYE76_002419 [Lolium multiflorum]
MNVGQMMTWEDFKLKFSKYHVPQGLIKKMRDEFRELKQGRMSMVEYRDRFLTLSRYAPDETDTNEKRKERFLNGLHDEMQTVLVNIPFADLEALVDSAIRMEGKLHRANENRQNDEPTRSHRSPQILAIDPRLPKLRHCTRSLFYLANVASNLAIDRRRPTAPSDPLGEYDQEKMVIFDIKLMVGFECDTIPILKVPPQYPTWMEPYVQTETYDLENGGSLVFERDLYLVSEKLERPLPSSTESGSTTPRGAAVDDHR